MKPRSAGILLHITSLPGVFGTGDIGNALSFLSFLKQAGIACWQFLPTCPVSGAFAYSPYMGYSAMAGNSLLISPELMVQDGFVAADDLLVFDSVSDYVADFAYALEVRQQLVSLAFTDFDLERSDFRQFCHEEAEWLDDYALYITLKEDYGGKSWVDWPSSYKNHHSAALHEFSRNNLSRLARVQFEQFIFYSQWQQLRDLARAKNIDLFGDVPIYVGHDSCDVWSNQNCFDLDNDGEPVLVAGVPPDYFSKTGQRWGNPLYTWETAGKKNRDLYRWWQLRFRQIGRMVDLVRIDHFRGFESYWAIAQSEETAINGKWLRGPGLGFFKEMTDAVGDLEIIAEDLGLITPEVEALRDDCGFAGMKILQFAFGSGADNSYLPQNYESNNAVVYGGTHDNDTAIGWFFDPDTPQKARDDFRRLANSDGTSAHRDFNRLAFASTSRLAIIAMQDVLGFGSDCRMNTPGTVENNWLWRCHQKYFSEDVASYLYKEVCFYNRLPRILEKKKAVRP